MLVLVVLGGCQLVFPLDGPGSSSTAITLRTTFTASTASNTVLSFATRPDVVDGDVMLLTIQGTKSVNTINFDSMSWTLLQENGPLDCSGVDYHAWFLRGIASSTTSFGFGFGSADAFVALGTAYSNATSARLGQLLRPGTSSSARTISSDPTTAAPGSVVWFGGAADSPWGPDPAEVISEDRVQNLVSYAQHSSDDQFPPVNFDVPIGFCITVAQVKVEP